MHSNLTRGATVIIVTSSLDDGWMNELSVLSRRGIRPMCVYINPTSFGGGLSDEVRGRLSLMKVPTLVVNAGDDLSVVLGERPS